MEKWVVIPCATQSPFSTSIPAKPVPKRFPSPKIDYNGTRDPEHHITKFMVQVLSNNLVQIGTIVV